MYGWAILGFTENDHWHPGIGDPTVAGWITVVAYFTAAFVCLKASIAARRRANPGEPGFWLLFALLLVFLGFNKQLDLQTWFTLVGKHLAQQEGWYSQRRIYQAIFIGLVALGGAATLLHFWRLGRGSVRHYRLALFGGVALTSFIIIRAASFHYVDKLLGVRLSYLRLNFILEVGGVLCIGIAAFK
ncbi:MAG TPA: hypothetical protein VMZ27_04265, partial [Candidatus Saccharimonadales bacterium]|nr:hypothetical protein [Candidatus Saccharimonadales bacterium]